MENSTVSHFTRYNLTNSFSDLSEPYQGYLKDLARAMFVNTLIYSIITIIGSIGNVFVLFVYSQRKWNDQLDSRYFIPRLAFFDLLLCLAFGIFEIIVVNVSYIYGSICKIFFFLTTFASCTSNAFLLAIAVQRFLMVCQPFGTQMTLSLRRRITALIISTNFLFSVPVLIIAGEQGDFKKNKTESLHTARCSFSNDQYPTFQIIYIVILVFVSIAYIIATVGMYIPITCVIYRHLSKTRNTNTENIMMARRDYTINAQEGYRKVGPEEEIENLDKGMNISKINVAINQRNKSTVSKNENRMQVLLFSISQSKYSISSVTNFNMIFFNHNLYLCFDLCTNNYCYGIRFFELF